MNVSKIKASLYSLIAAGLVASSSAFAVPVADTLVYSYRAPNQGNPELLSMLKTATGNDYTVTDVSRDRDAVAAFVDGLWQFDLGSLTPAYFVLRFNTNGAASTTHNTYVFRNVGELEQFAFTNADVGYLTGGSGCPITTGKGCGIHTVNQLLLVGQAELPPVEGDVPEPGSVLLLGAGLAALAARRRKQQ